MCLLCVCTRGQGGGKVGRPEWLGAARGPGIQLRGSGALLLLTGLSGVYCYRVNRRLFLVPSDPSTPCRLCRVPRDQRGPETLAAPAQVR